MKNFVGVITNNDDECNIIIQLEKSTMEALVSVLIKEEMDFSVSHITDSLAEVIIPAEYR